MLRIIEKKRGKKRGKRKNNCWKETRKTKREKINEDSKSKGSPEKDEEEKNAERELRDARCERKKEKERFGVMWCWLVSYEWVRSIWLEL